MTESTGRKVFAIVSDYDGTLVPAVGMRNSDKNMVPTGLTKILSEISKTIPVCILSSKDYFFLKDKVPFASVISCILGLETLTTDSLRSRPASRLLVPNDILEKNSLILEAITAELSSMFSGSMSIETKRTTTGHIAGITFDWREQSDWKRFSESVTASVKRSLSSAVKSHRSQFSSEINIHTYRTHPFVDVYSVPCDKGTGLDVISSLLAYRREKGEIIYLGDSENDNPAFGKAGISIGVSSDPRLRPQLNCRYHLDFEDLESFLVRLKDNDFVFTPRQLS